MAISTTASTAIPTLPGWLDNFTKAATKIYEQYKVELVATESIISQRVYIYQINDRTVKIELSGEIASMMDEEAWYHFLETKLSSFNKIMLVDDFQPVVEAEEFGGWAIKNV